MLPAERSGNTNTVALPATGLFGALRAPTLGTVLLARVKRTLSRNAGTVDDILKIGNIKINHNEGKVYAGDEVVELTALEYRLLLIFAANKGALLSRTQILDKIWDSEGNFVEDNTLTVYVKRLREKLGDNINIETVRGIGYRVGQYKKIKYVIKYDLGFIK